MIAITDDAIDTQALVNGVITAECGAVVLFTGVVRRLSDELLPVTGLRYEAHASMALAEMETIAQEARERFGPCNIGAVHRTGDLAIGDIAVAVAVASAHRAQAFDACEYVIDEIKERAQIWKKEFYADGGANWRENAPHTSSYQR